MGGDSGTYPQGNPSESKQHRLANRWNDHITNPDNGNPRTWLYKTKLPSEGGFPTHFNDGLTAQGIGGWMIFGIQAAWLSHNAQPGANDNNLTSIEEMARTAAGFHDTDLLSAAQALYDIDHEGMAAGEWQRRAIIRIGYEHNGPWFAYYSGQDPSLRTDHSAALLAQPHVGSLGSTKGQNPRRRAFTHALAVGGIGWQHRALTPSE